MNVNTFSKNLLPWSLETEIAFVLDLDPMLTSVVFAKESKIANKLKCNCVILRGLQNIYKIYDVIYL
jgi:hypothetical protein